MSLLILAAALDLLPLGTVRPEGHLLHELQLQRDGLVTHADELYPDIAQSDWVTNASRGGEFSWERGPYYARGLVALALVLNDDELMRRARRWIESTLASQRPNGDFGPRDRNWWANMLSLSYLRDWAQANDDPRIVAFMQRYFAFQEQNLNAFSLARESCWAQARGGDEIDVVLWLHAQTKDARWFAFAQRLAEESADWTSYYSRGGSPAREYGYRAHVVNFMQGLKLPALKWGMSGDLKDRDAYVRAFDPKGWAVQLSGRPDAMLNGSEPLSDRSTSAGTELCAIAERVISCGVVISQTGLLSAADDLEDVVYNTLPSTLSPDRRGIRYYHLLNQPMCINQGLLFANNGMGAEVTGATCPGPHSGFGCCRSNWHVALPKFVQAMWMRKDEGLAAVLHGPSSVTAELKSGRVTLRETTDYPASGKVTIEVVEGGGRFPLYVRIPRWADVDDRGTFRRIVRDWNPGDSVSFEFPMTLDLSFWANNAVCVRKGPYLYSLCLKADWKRSKGYKVPYENRRMPTDSPFPRWEIHPTQAWNYALCLDSDGRQLSDVQEVAPNVLEVSARKTDYAGWGCMRVDAPGRAAEPPVSPVAAEFINGENCRIRLVPMAESQLRITLFPWIANQ